MRSLCQNSAPATPAGRTDAASAALRLKAIGDCGTGFGGTGVLRAGMHSFTHSSALCPEIEPDGSRSRAAGRRDARPSRRGPAAALAAPAAPARDGRHPRRGGRRRVRRAPSRACRPGYLLGLVAVMAGAWPLAAFLCGLYAREDLRTWASGVGEAPKLVLTCLALSWPLLGMLMLLDAPHPAPGALAATLAVAVAAGLTRAAARVGVHRAPELQQRTLIVGSGEVAQRLVDRVRSHPELGLIPVGYIDDEDGPPLALPHLGGLDVLPELVALGPRRPRDDRLLPRPPRGAARGPARVPRRRHRRRRRPAAVRVPRRRAHRRPDRRPAAALDRRAELLAPLPRGQARARRRRARRSG